MINMPISPGFYWAKTSEGDQPEFFEVYCLPIGTFALRVSDNTEHSIFNVQIVGYYLAD